MKKLTTISSIFALMAVPAVAAPTHTSATFPQSGVMEEDYQYTGQANVTNLKVSSGTANTLAGYTDCPSGYPNSDAGATSTDECYKACTVADLPANSHAATASGKNYSGANVTDTCAIASCDTGYTLTNHVVYPQGTPDLMTLIGASEAAVAEGHKSISDTLTGSGQQSDDAVLSTYGITQNGEFVVDYGVKGKIHGFARCSSRSATDPWDETEEPYTYTLQPDGTTMTLPDSTGPNCYCKIDGYTPNGQSMQALSAPWVFGKAHNSCLYNCALSCTMYLELDYPEYLDFRAAVFGSLGNSVASCDANVITINWDHADSADITANDAGSVTYGGNINTPKKAQHINGKIFTGWTFVTPNQ